jgi:hypothetical protein
MTFIDAYKEAFSRNYPHHTCKVTPRRVRGELRYAIIINGDKGDLLLSEEDVRSATRDFNRGK